jgi:hypothetical protein
MLQNYLACGNTSESLDFFSLNSYSWCGASSYQQSGYDQLEKNSEDLHIPIFMSETGCNVVRPRDFKDQEALFGPMADTWSGSIIYEWIEEANNYGIVKYGDKVDPASPGAPADGFPRSGTPIPVQPDFSNLGAVWKTLTPSGVKASAYNHCGAPFFGPSPRLQLLAHCCSDWQWLVDEADGFAEFGLGGLGAVKGRGGRQPWAQPRGRRCHDGELVGCDCVVVSAV